MSRTVFIDTEVDPQTERVYDYGAANSLQDKLHTSSETGFTEFISGSKFICGHNILAHDLKLKSAPPEFVHLKISNDKYR